MAESEKELKNLLLRVKEKSEKVGWKCNIENKKELKNLLMKVKAENEKSWFKIQYSKD